MNSDLQTMGWVAAALVTAMVVALIATPVVKSLAFKVGAVDVPKDNRRMHDHPIPRMGGLAIFLGFLLSVLLFLELNPQMRGMLLGAVIIVVLGIFDDIYSLPAMFKFVVQIVAALVAVLSGNVIQILSNPNVLSPNPWWDLGWLSYPATVLWIVAITNAVNLIDGLDGLACGVSTISSMTLLVIALVAIAFGKVESALYGVVSLFVTTKVMDKVLYGMGSSKVAYIISDAYEEIARAITHDMERGLTLLHGEGGWSGTDKKVLMVAFKQRQIVAIKRTVKEIDPAAFLIVCDAHEVLGDGFREYKQNDL